MSSFSIIVNAFFSWCTVTLNCGYRLTTVNSKTIYPKVLIHWNFHFGIKEIPNKTYQGVGVVVKLWFSILSNLKSHIVIQSHIITHIRETNDDAHPYTHPYKCPYVHSTHTPMGTPTCTLHAVYVQPYAQSYVHPYTHLYMHCCNLIGWGSPSQPIRSFSLKNLINIKSWFFPFSNEPAINISQQSTNILETITHRAKWSRCWYSQLYQHFFQ